MFAGDLGIDVWESIDAASTKPFGYMRFTPGPGVGGHCLPIDPSYLSWAVRRRLGRSFRFVELANDVNANMPDYVVRRLVHALNRMGKPVQGSQVLLLGLAYKRNTADARTSPGMAIAESLAELGADVRVADPHLRAENVPFVLVELTADDRRRGRRRGDRHRPRRLRLRAGARRTPASCSTPATASPGPTSSRSDRGRAGPPAPGRPAPSTGPGTSSSPAARGSSAPTCAGPSPTTPAVERIVVLDDLSTGSADNLRRGGRRRARRRVDPRRRPPAAAPWRAPTPWSTWRRGPRCRVARGPRRHPRGQRHRHPAGARGGPAGRRARRWWWRPRPRSTGPTGPSRPARTSPRCPLSPYAASKLAAEAYALVLRPIVRAPRARVPLLQRLRPAAAGRPRLRGGRPRLRRRRPRRARPSPCTATGARRATSPSSAASCASSPRRLERSVTAPGPVNLAFGGRASLLELADSPRRGPRPSP